jgi:hypothetical protein
MNVCALDVVARSPDFETVAATMEMRGWEWDFLHGIDGETSVGNIARHNGIDLDSAVDFVHEALRCGLVVLPTMTLQAYRSAPSAASLRSSSPTLSLGTGATAEAYDFATPAAAAGAISFSSDAFDWDAPEPALDETEESAEPAMVEAAGSVHYDDRFGVEHPDGPFAATQPDDALSATRFDDAFSIQSHHEDEPPAIAAQHEEPFADVAPALVDPFATTAPAAEPVATAASQPVDDPFAVAPQDDPFAVAPQEDPFAAAVPHAPEPFPSAPSENGKAYTNGVSVNGHNPVRFDELFAAAPPPAAEQPVAEQPVAEQPIAAQPAPAPIAFDVASFSDAPAPFADAPVEPHAQTHEPPSVVTQPAAAQPPTEALPEEAAEESAPGSISFSFSADEPAGDHETYDAPGVREAPEVWTPPVSTAVAPPAQPAAKAEPVADGASKPTQSLFYEREAAADTGAGRELEEKVKNWKDSLSWREQQELSEAEALGRGSDKSGVIGNLLRALGVR